MEQALAHSVKAGNVHVVARILSWGASCSQRDSTGKTLLHTAADWGQLEVVQLLLQHNAPVRIADMAGRTPLHDAACWGRYQIVELLLLNGAPVDAQDRMGYTPLHFSVSSGNRKVTQLLLKHGASLHMMAKDGNTPWSICQDERLKAVLGGYIGEAPLSSQRTYYGDSSSASDSGRLVLSRQSYQAATPGLMFDSPDISIRLWVDDNETTGNAGF